MSNVLIGIIGVILFIGLAIASASFLGPRFTQSTMMSKAAAVTAGMDQIGNAARLRKTGSGSSVQAQALSTLTSEGYLKSIPQNVVDPVNSGFDIRAIDGSTTGTGVYVIAGSAPSLSTFATALSVCKEINLQTKAGNTDGSPVTADSPPGRMGCFYPTSAFGNLNGLLLYYRKI